ncbi:MAG: SCO family protein [Magnetococcales bacterium]|nr:SCO family protein [Magnetococcales bacterium]
MTSRKFKVIYWGLALVGIIVAGVAWMEMSALEKRRAASVSLIPKDLAETLLPKARPLKPFALQNHDGGPFTENQFKGKWDVVFFGYTQCPDVCPLSLSIMAEVFNSLEKSDPQVAEHYRGVFVSVDPKRDDLKILKDYAVYFHPKLTGVTGKPKQLQNIARQMNVAYMVEPGDRPDNYLVNHTATMFLVDPQGRYAGVLQTPHEADQIIAKLKKVIAFSQQ